MKTALIAIAATSGAAMAQVTLTEWDVVGQPGSQVTQPATFSAANVTGETATRFGNTPSTGSNAFTGNNWSVGGYFAFGVTIDAGYQADLDTLFIGTRSSGTGPGFLGLYSSLDGFANPIFNFVQSGSSFLNSAVDLSSLGTVTGNVEFRVVVQNDANANGTGSIAGTGSFRITNYFVDGTFDRNWQITGEVSLIPSPASASLLALGGLVATRRRRA